MEYIWNMETACAAYAESIHFTYHTRKTALHLRVGAITVVVTVVTRRASG